MSRRSLAFAGCALLVGIAAVVVVSMRKREAARAEHIEPEKDELGVRVPWCIHDVGCARDHARILTHVARTGTPRNDDLAFLGIALAAAYARNDCVAADELVVEVRASSTKRAELARERDAVSRAHWGACGIVLRPTPRPVADTDAVRLTMTACEGECPVYSVTVRGDGSVDYVGERFVKEAGPRHSNLPRAQTARLFELLDTLHADTMGHSGSGIYDAPGAELQATRGGATVTALDQAYCFSTEGIENGMCFLVGKVNELSGVLTWVQ